MQINHYSNSLFTRCPIHWFLTKTNVNCGTKIQKTNEKFKNFLKSLSAPRLSTSGRGEAPQARLSQVPAPVGVPKAIPAAGAPRRPPCESRGRRAEDRPGSRPGDRLGANAVPHRSQPGNPTSTSAMGHIQLSLSV